VSYVICWVYYSFACLEGWSWWGEWQREKKERKLPRYILGGGKLIQTHIIFFFGPKTSWCAKHQLPGGTPVFLPFYLFIFFIFILPIAIFIDAHGRGRRLVHYYTSAAHNTRGPFRGVVCLRCRPNAVNWTFTFIFTLSSCFAPE